MRFFGRYLKTISFGPLISSSTVAFTRAPFTLGVPTLTDRHHQQPVRTASRSISWPASMSHAVHINCGSFDGFVLLAAAFQNCIFHYASPIFTSPQSASCFMDPFAGKLGVENRRSPGGLISSGLINPTAMPYFFDVTSASTEIRTLVLALKGLRPGPLDDGGNGQDFTITCRGSRIFIGQFYPSLPGYLQQTGQCPAFRKPIMIKPEIRLTQTMPVVLNFCRKIPTIPERHNHHSG